MPEYLEHIVSYVCRATFNDLPKNVVLRAKEVLADTFSVIAAEAQEDEVKGLTKRLLDPKAKRVASLIGSGTRTEPLKAALINGTAGTFLELVEGSRNDWRAQSHGFQYFKSTSPSYSQWHQAHLGRRDQRAYIFNKTG